MKKMWFIPFNFIILITLNCIPQSLINDLPPGRFQPLNLKNNTNVLIDENKAHNQQKYVKEYYLMNEKDNYCLVVELNKIADYNVNSIENPDRIYIDILNTNINKIVQNVNINDNYVKQIRTGQHSSGFARIVLDLKQKVSHKVLVDSTQKRIYLNIYPAKTIPAVEPVTNKLPKVKQEFTNSKKINPIKLNLQAQNTIAKALGMKIRTIIIDPGHGGKDPGAVSSNGTKEKDITLAIANRLQQIIEKETNFKVLMTRHDDSFVELEERTSFANTNNGDLFISIHVNAHNLSQKSGIETYYLSFTNSSEARRVASFENKWANNSYSDLEGIVAQILNNSKIDESRLFAEIIQNNLIERTNRYNRGVKKAPFVVLTGANMPSILTEVAFLTNPRGEELVKSKFYKYMIAEAIYNGIIEYADNLLGSNSIVANRSD